MLDLRIFPDPDRVAHECAEWLVTQISEAFAARGRASIALAGGSTPERLYRLLVTPPFRERIAWNQIDIFFSDERCVPQSDERSNFHLAENALLGPLSLTAPSVRAAYPTSGVSADDAARSYSGTIAAALGDSPVFDIILLGLGDDGHTASLFPGKSALSSTAIAAGTTPGVLPPPVDRVTFSFATINGARAVALLVTGKNKADAVRRWRAGDETLETLPIVGVGPTHGVFVAFLDEAASASSGASS